MFGTGLKSVNVPRTDLVNVSFRLFSALFGSFDRNLFPKETLLKVSESDRKTETDVNDRIDDYCQKVWKPHARAV